MQREPIPRLPVFGWQALRGERDAGTPCVLDLPQVHYTTSGRGAILLALEALGVQPGDRVLLPTYHCPTMVAPAISLGALPCFYPIDATGAPDLAWLDRQELDGVRVMLAAHFFGVPQPMETIRSWCDAHGIALLEDCAHALFGRSGDRPVGAWGDIAIASLTKFLPVPEGGCVVMSRGHELPPLAPGGAGVQVRAVVDILDVGAIQGAMPGLNTLISGSLGLLRRLRGTSAAPAVQSGEACPSGPAGSCRADFAIDAPLAHRRLARACGWIADTLPRGRIVERRRRHFERLRQALSGHGGMHPLLGELPPDAVPYVFPLWVQHPDPGYAELRRLRMPVFRWDQLWLGTDAGVDDRGLEWSHHVLQLACHQDLSDADLDALVNTLLRLYADPTGPAAR